VYRKATNRALVVHAAAYLKECVLGTLKCPSLWDSWVDGV